MSRGFAAFLVHSCYVVVEDMSLFCMVGLLVCEYGGANVPPFCGFGLRGNEPVHYGFREGISVFQLSVLATDRL